MLMVVRGLGVVVILGAGSAAIESALANAALASDATPQPAPASNEAPFHRILVMPFVGVQQVMTGDYAQYISAGLRLGALAGWRVNRAISLNFEGSLDKLNMSAPIGLAHPSIRKVALSPLAHFRENDIELVIGPSAGLWWLIDDTSYRSRGWGLGFNAGMFLSTRAGVSFGLLLGYETRETTEACAGSPCIEFRDSEQSLGLSVAALN